MKKFFGGAILAPIVCAISILYAAEPRPDVSRIIDNAEARQVLGESVKSTTPRSGDGADGYYSKCNYYSLHRGKSLLVRLQLPGPNAVGPQKELELLAAADASMQPVADLGDAAKMAISGGDTGFASRVLMLYVAKGSAFVTVGLGGFADDNDALEKAKSIAQKLLASL
jgi:hypothetical protein